MKRFADEEEMTGGLAIPLTPLIDCIFLLLIFFLYSRFRTPEGELGARLPREAGVVPAIEEVETILRKQILVELSAEDRGEVRVRVAGVQIRFDPGDEKDRERAMDGLVTVIAERRRAESESFVILKPSARVPFGIVIRCFDSARLAGVEDVSFAPPEAEFPDVG